jgi:hypothetical protein
MGRKALSNKLSSAMEKPKKMETLLIWFFGAINLENSIGKKIFSVSEYFISWTLIQFFETF